MALSIRSGKATGLSLLILSLLLIAFAACGSDDPAAADSVEIDGETLTWSPPWEEGDARQVTITSETELSPELQAQLEQMQSMGGEDFQGQLEGASGQPIAGTVRFVSASDGSAVAEYEIPLDSLIDQMTSTEVPSENAQMLSALVGLMGQLDLAVEFSVGPDGSITGVTNLEELTTTLTDFVDSLMLLAETGGEESMSAEDRAQLEAFLEQLPESEFVQELADSATHSATGQMFLMRAGEYTIGQPVIMEGTAPSAIGIMGDAQTTYLLKSIDDGSATFDVAVVPEDVDVIELMTRLIQEFAVMAGEEPDEAIEGLNEIPAEMQPVIDEISQMLSQPYTVTLTIDTETGWVTSADWAMEFSMPQSLIEQLESVQEFGGEPTMDLEDIHATIMMRSVISQAPDSD